MIKLCRVDEIRAAEQEAVTAGRSVDDLMLAAGQGVADFIHERAGTRPGAAVLLIGPGNNGGDGLVTAARLCEHGWHCRAWGYKRRGATGTPLSSEQAEQIEWIDSLDELGRACRATDVIVDAVFGIGGRRELPAEIADAFTLAWDARRRQRVTLVALDTPSGVDADTGEAVEAAFRADYTVMVGLPKIGLYRSEAMRRAGQLHLVDIGLPEPSQQPGEPSVVTTDDVCAWLPRRAADTHKWAVGSVLVVGGAALYYGAPHLAGAAAARAGAGVVTLAVPPSVVGPIASSLIEVTFLPLPEGELGGDGMRMASIVREALPRYSAFIIGPGLGQEPPVGDFLTALFGFGGQRSAPGFSAAPAARQERADRFEGRGVIDADGLNWLAQQPEWPSRLSGMELVLTPHPRELARLIGGEPDEIAADPWSFALDASRRFDQVVVLKVGHATVACPDGTLIVAPQAMAALATAGSGDVLAGIIGSLMAQGLPPRIAAAAGVLIGNEAARGATRTAGTLGLVASDVVEALPATMRDLYDARW